MPVARKVWGAILVLLVAMLGIAAATYWRSDVGHARAAELTARQHELTSSAVQWHGMAETSIAKTMAGALSADPSVADLFKDEQTRSAAAIVKLNRLELTGYVAWLFWGVAHIYFLIERRSRLLVALNWLAEYVMRKRGARIISVDVRPVGR